MDNNASAVSMENPGAYLTGTVTLSAAASSKAGVTSVTIQRSPSGTSTWTDICVDTTSPYGCSWDSATVANGLYDFRAVLLDGAGKTTTSDATTGHQVDNTPLRGFDVQAANGGAAGKLQPGDAITFTYNQQINLSSITPGWTGAAQAVTVRLQDGALLGLGATGDTLDVQRSGGAVNLGTVNLKQNFVKTQQDRTVQRHHDRGNDDGQRHAGNHRHRNPRQHGQRQQQPAHRVGRREHGLDAVRGRP